MDMDRPPERQRISKRDRQREQLILAMLQQPNLEKAAASVGISVSTAYRIRKTSEFQAEYLAARREEVSQAIARLQHASGAAASTMVRVMVAPESPASTRLHAADKILVHAQKGVVVEDLGMRMTAMEQEVRQKRGEPCPGVIQSQRHPTAAPEDMAPECPTEPTE